MVEPNILIAWIAFAILLYLVTGIIFIPLFGVNISWIPLPLLILFSITLFYFTGWIFIPFLKESFCVQKDYSYQAYQMRTKDINENLKKMCTPTPKHSYRYSPKPYYTTCKHQAMGTKYDYSVTQCDKNDCVPHCWDSKEEKCVACTNHLNRVTCNTDDKKTCNDCVYCFWDENQCIPLPLIHETFSNQQIYLKYPQKNKSQCCEGCSKLSKEGNKEICYAFCDGSNRTPCNDYNTIDDRELCQKCKFCKWKVDSNGRGTCIPRKFLYIEPTPRMKWSPFLQGPYPYQLWTSRYNSQ